MKKNIIDCIIFISAEDNKYNVLGGIGTYLGLLIRETKKLFPEIDVYWITKSSSNKEFEENNNGATTYYLSEIPDYSNKPFYQFIDKWQTDEVVKNYIFNLKITDQVKKILSIYHNKNVVIESGEWEGLGHQIYKLYNLKNVLKVVRLHTPLATCIQQNKLNTSPANSLQLIREYMLISNADYISASTEHIKNKVINDVLGKNDPLSKDITVIPNPIDTTCFRDNICNKNESIKLINKVLKKTFISSNTFNIFMVGSVEQRKGAHIAIDSVPKVIDTLPNARFCYIGHHGDNRVSLNSNTKLSPKYLLNRIPKKYHKYVAFTNYLDHAILPKIIRCGDIFPIMSLGDNFHGVVAEVSLSEKPIIALERAGVKEMLSDRHGKCLAYSIGSSVKHASEKLSAAIIDLYHKELIREQIGSSLRQLMLDKYNPQKITTRIINDFSYRLNAKLQ